MGDTWLIRHDRRRLALVTKAALMAGALLLAGNALADSPSLVVLYAVPAVTIGLTAIQGAALDAAVPRLVPIGDISAASALLSSASKIGGIGGPVLGATMYLGWGPAPAYALDAGTNSGTTKTGSRSSTKSPLRQNLRAPDR